MDPSFGSSIASLADVEPFLNAFARVWQSNFSLPSQPSPKPTKNCAIRTPELPLAPSIAASEIIFVKTSNPLFLLQ